jgi:hypothetical protein
VPPRRLIDNRITQNHRAGVDSQISKELDLRCDNLFRKHDKTRDLRNRLRVSPLQILLNITDQRVIRHYGSSCHATSLEIPAAEKLA